MKQQINYGSLIISNSSFIIITTNTSWEDYDWRKMKVASEKTGREVKKVFDANFGAVNAYHEKKKKKHTKKFKIE